MKKACCLLILLMTTPLQAMTWQELNAEITSVESGNPGNSQVIARFSEMVQMLVIYSRAVQETDPTSQLFCPTPGTPMELDDIVSMVRTEARQTNADSTTQVQSLMLASFRRRFPCS